MRSTVGLIKDLAPQRFRFGTHAVLVQEHVVAKFPPRGKLSFREHIPGAHRVAKVCTHHASSHEEIMQGDWHPIRNPLIEHRHRPFERIHFVCQKLTSWNSLIAKFGVKSHWLSPNARRDPEMARAQSDS